MYSLCEAKDARHYPVVNRATRVGTMTTLDPRAPSLVTDSDQAIASCSPRELIARREETVLRTFRIVRMTLFS